MLQGRMAVFAVHYSRCHFRSLCNKSQFFVNIIGVLIIAGSQL